MIKPFQPFCDLIRTIPGIGDRCAESDRGRDRRRHGCIPDRGASSLLGGSLPGQQRVCGPGEINRHSTRQPLPQSCSRRGRAVDHEHPRHLPRREIPSDRRQTRPEEGIGRRRARDPTAIWTMAHTVPNTTNPDPTTTSATTPNASNGTPPINSNASASPSPSPRQPPQPRKDCAPHGIFASEPVLTDN